MSQVIRKLKITKVLSQAPQETHDETIYFVYFDFDGVNLSFNELLRDLRNKRCVMATDLAEAFSSAQVRRLRKVCKGRNETCTERTTSLRSNVQHGS